MQCSKIADHGIDYQLIAALIEELYTFLRQADSRELNGLFRELDAARAAGDAVKAGGKDNTMNQFG